MSGIDRLALARMIGGIQPWLVCDADLAGDESEQITIHADSPERAAEVWARRYHWVDAAPDDGETVDVAVITGPGEATVFTVEARISVTFRASGSRIVRVEEIDP